MKFIRKKIKYFLNFFIFFLKKLDIYSNMRYTDKAELNSQGGLDMAKCYITGKTTVTGNKRSHALNATRRTWKANLQTVRIKDENGNVKKVKISARALKKGNIERA